MSRLTTTQLKRIAAKLNEQRKEWDWQVYSQAQMAKIGTYDPPCAALRGRLGPLIVDITTDREVYVDFKPPLDWPPWAVDLPEGIASGNVLSFILQHLSKMVAS